MSWWQETLTLNAFERTHSGRVVFVLQLRMDQQENGLVKYVARRSYSEFRSLWTSILKTTSSNSDDRFTESNHRRSRKESWSVVSRVLSGKVLTSDRDTGCRCTQSRCPFRRLYHQMKHFPFPRKQVLVHLDATALAQRRKELENFLHQLQDFFRGYSRSFLDELSASDQCSVLKLMNIFIGVDDAIPEEIQPMRKRMWSYNAGSVRSSVPESLTDEEPEHSFSNQEDVALVHDIRVSTTYPRPQVCHIRSPSYTESAIHQLPQLQIKMADVKTSEMALLELRDGYVQLSRESYGYRMTEHDTEDRLWEVALHRASALGHCHAVQAFLRRGIDPNAVCQKGGTSLHVSCEGGFVDIVQALLVCGADVDATDVNGKTPLMCAVSNGQFETSLLLLRTNANPNICSDKNVSIIHQAVKIRSSILLRLLLSHNANANIVAKPNNCTPLHLAIESGSVELCSVLLQHGAVTTHRNESGQDAKELATELKY